MPIEIVGKLSTACVYKIEAFLLPGVYLELFLLGWVEVEVQFGPVLDNAPLKQVHNDGVTLNSEPSQYFLGNLYLLTHLYILQFPSKYLPTGAHAYRYDQVRIHEHLHELLVAT